MRVLFVSANPTGTMKLELNDELRRFQHSLSGHPVKMTLLPAAQPEDLEIALQGKDFDVVHFSGHAEDDGILMRTPAGTEVLIEVEELRKLFASQTSLKLAVLNACETEAVADAIKKHVGTVIGTRQKLDDRAARTLTKVFYAALASRKSIAEAYESAMGAIERFCPNPKEELYVAHGLDNEVNLLTEESSEDAGVEFDGRPAFDSYFYVTYLDKQIEKLTEDVAYNKKVFTWMLGVGIFLAAVLLYNAWPIDLMGWLKFVFLNKDAIITDRPLLEWLATLGAGIPASFSAFQGRVVVHRNGELRKLQQLRQLVKTSDSTDMSPDLQNRLHNILEQSLRGAQEQ